MYNPYFWKDPRNRDRLEDEEELRLEQHEKHKKRTAELASHVHWRLTSDNPVVVGGDIPLYLLHQQVPKKRPDSAVRSSHPVLHPLWPAPPHLLQAQAAVAPPFIAPRRAYPSPLHPLCYPSAFATPFQPQTMYEAPMSMPQLWRGIWLLRSISSAVYHLLFHEPNRPRALQCTSSAKAVGLD